MYAFMKGRYVHLWQTRVALQQRKLRRTDDAALASGWASLLYIDKTFAYSAELDQKIQAALD